MIYSKQATSHKPQAFKLGFTLSELLVSLAVLGLIAGLTVPSIVASVEKSKTKALQKETIQIISSVIQDGVLNGDFSAITNWDVLSPSSPLIQLLTNKLNARPCPRGENIAPCNFNWVNGYPTYDNHSARWVLPNGVQIGLQPQSIYLTGNSLLFTVDVR